MSSMHLKQSLLALASIAAAAQIQAAVPGYAGNVTGGGSATPVVASTMSAIQNAIDSYSGSGGLVIQYTGSFDPAPILSNICGQWSKPKQEVSISGKSNITILGANGSSANFGIRIKGSSSNIIVRNMTIGLVPGGGSDGDAIGIEGSAHNIWLDHNELYSRNFHCSGTPGDDTTFDGLIDIKSSTDNITISYNYIHDHQKVSLGGSSDSDTSVRNVTWAYNIVQNVQERAPMNRAGNYHMYNNYYTGVVGSGMNSRVNGNMLIEGNYFENSNNPVVARYSSTIGYWDLRNNNIMSPSDFGTYGITWTVDSDTKKNADDWQTTKPYPSAIPYSYTAYPGLKAKCIALAAAGPGKGLKEAADVVSSCGNSSSSSSVASSAASSAVSSRASSSAASSAVSSAASSAASSRASSSTASSVQSGSNLALSGTATASGQSGSSRVAAMAIDGNTSTRWEASNSSPGSWLRVSWSSAKTISGVTLREYASRITGYRVEYLSGSSWVSLATGTTIGSAKSHSFGAVSTTAVRMFVTSASGQPSITEFEVY